MALEDGRVDLSRERRKKTLAQTRKVRNTKADKVKGHGPSSNEARCSQTAEDQRRKHALPGEKQWDSYIQRLLLTLPEDSRVK